MEETINTNEEANKAKNITDSESPDVAFGGVQPLNLPERPQTDVNTSFQPFIDSATQNIAKAQETRDQGINNIREVMDAIGDTENRRIEEMEAQGVNTLQEDVTRFDNLISSKTQKYRNELQNLENQNVASSYITGQKNRLNIQATRELANLSIIRDSQAGRLEDAKAWVNQKIDAETAQLKSQLDFQQFVYEENKDILTAEQDKQFQLQVRQTENELAKEKEKQEKIQNMSLTAAQYGASPEALDAISGASSFEEALNVAGEFLGKDFELRVDQQKFENKIKEQTLALSRSKFQFEKDQVQAELDSQEVEEQIKTKQEIQSFKDNYNKRKNIISGALNNANGLLLSSSATGNFNLASRPGRLFAPSAVARFEGEMRQLLAKDTIDSLIDSKKQGASYGSLTDGERVVIGTAASTLAGYADYDEEGKATGRFNAAPQDVKEALETIEYYDDLNYYRSTGEIPKGGRFEEEITEQYVNSVEEVVNSENNEYSSAGYEL